MRRSTILALVIALMAAALIAWWWLTAPPRDDAEALAEMIALAPADVEGAVAIASPRRTGRWLVRHRQAAALLALAAPQAVPAFISLESAATALAVAARSPLLLTWRGSEAALAATTGHGAAAALAQLASSGGLAIAIEQQGEQALVRLATSPELLAGGPAGTPPELTGRLSALARVHGRWWRVRAGRGRLVALSGDGRAPGRPGPGSRLVTGDLAQLLEPAGLRIVPRGPARLLLDGSGGWAISLPGRQVGKDLKRLLALEGDEPGATVPGARRWRGLAGELWIIPDDLAVASVPELLAAVVAMPADSEQGWLRGEDAARACRRLARLADILPPLRGRGRQLRRAADQLEPLGSGRWSLSPSGGALVLEW